jgi:hypothetical protein
MLLEVLRNKVEERVIAARTHEIVAREVVLAELWDNAMKAKAAEPVTDKDGTAVGMFQANWAASTKAIERYGKETHAMFVDRREVKTGPFDELSHDQLKELRDRLLREIEAEAAEEANATINAVGRPRRKKTHAAK